MKRSVKRILKAGLAVMVGSALLTGCGSSGGKETQGTKSAEDKTAEGKTAVPGAAENNVWSKTITLADGSSYPGKTVSIVCPYAAGGGVDLGIRLFAEYAQEYTDATLIVENIEGGNGLVGLQTALNRGSDGKTIWHMDTGPQYVTTSVSACPFDVVKDMSLIGQMLGDDRVWVARADESRFSDGKALIAYIQEHPGELTCAVSGAGAISGLSTSYLGDAIGGTINIIGYNGGSEAKAAFLGKHCDIMAAGVSEIAGMLEEGQCTVLLTLTDDAIYDGIPTVKELGYDAMSLSTDRGLAMSGQTDPAIVQYWSDIMEMVCADPDFIADADAQSLEVRYRDAEEFTQQFIDTTAIWYDVKEALGQ